jgi:ribosome-associated translation inhibitor RaiA
MKRNSANNGSGLNINLLYRGLDPRTIWRSLVEAHLKKLQHLASIISARITLERQRQLKPAFRVSAVLEVPGPDFHAEASGYTLQAAVGKVIENLRRQMQSRRNQLIERHKGKGGRSVLPGLSGR